MEEIEERKDEGGGGGWIMTFADLMSLLMCFFVLLLSFSEMDVLKFKRLSGSMSEALVFKLRCALTTHLKVPVLLPRNSPQVRRDPRR